MKKLVRDWSIISILLVAAITIFLNIRVVVVMGNSMEPTFKNHQLLIASTDTANLNINDIVVFQRSNDVSIKRIIAMAGSQISLRDSSVYIDGILISGLESENSAVIEYTLANDEFFVIGDNAQVSLDSRNYGPIKQNQIIGKILFS